jgi:hypothetical protein
LYDASKLNAPIIALSAVVTEMHSRSSVLSAFALFFANFLVIWQSCSFNAYAVQKYNGEGGDVADLTVNSALLNDLQQKLSSITGRMDSVQRAVRNADASALGASNLVDGVHGFADDWSYGTTLIGQHCDNATQAIKQVGKAFDQVDVKLADSLTKPQESQKSQGV